MSSLLSKFNQETIKDIRDYVLAQGLLMASPNGINPTNLAVTLMPTPFPRPLFNHALKIQPTINQLVDTLSRDNDFIQDTFEKVQRSDIFVKKLMDIYNELQTLGDLQTTSLGIHRSDYLVDISGNDSNDQLGLKMVEINTIASSFGGHCYNMQKLHKFVSSRYLSSSVPQNGGECCGSDRECCNEECLSVLVDGLATAWKEYGKEKSFILFIVSDNELNIFDHRQIEYDIWNRYSIPVVRRTLEYVGQYGVLTPEREIFIDDKEISVVYYRCGYVPAHYPTDTEWSGRRLLELSKASNCPSVSYQLIGFKKVQQVISLPGKLEKYCTNEKDEMIANLRMTFAGQYTLEQTPEGDKAVEMAMANPHKYVMKPQREGGGNNIYGDEIVECLKNLSSSSEREQYILMELIKAPTFNNIILKRNDLAPIEMRVINELGIYGVFVRKGENVLMNATACGCLVRSKPHSSNEGGISIGIAALDCPNLMSNEEYCKHIIT